MVELGLRVNKIGNSSVTYEVGVFERNKEDPRAVGGYTHVFVERDKRRPQPDGMPGQIRDGLEKLVHPEKPRL